jgi:hypothetical protein
LHAWEDLDDVGQDVVEDHEEKKRFRKPDVILIDGEKLIHLFKALDSPIVVRLLEKSRISAAKGLTLSGRA